MKAIISLSINLSKIDKSKIVKGKNGAQYYNFTSIVNDENDQFGNNVQLIEPQTKEQRAAKAPRTFLGNGRVIWQGQSTTTVASKAAQTTITETPASSYTTDDLPF